MWFIQRSCSLESACIAYPVVQDYTHTHKILQSSKLSSDYIPWQMNWFGPGQTNPENQTQARPGWSFGEVCAAVWAVCLKVKSTLHCTSFGFQLSSKPLCSQRFVCILNFRGIMKRVMWYALLQLHWFTYSYTMCRWTATHLQIPCW